MALSADKVRKFRNLAPSTQHPVIASTTIYRGAACTRNSSGDVRGLSTSDSVFMGFTDAKVDNASGAAGDKQIELYPAGEVYLAVTSVDDNDDEGSTVYASDNDTFTLASTGNIAVGKITQWDTGTSCWVRFEAAAIRSI